MSDVRRLFVIASALAVAGSLFVVSGSEVRAAQAPIGLGTAASYAIIAGSAITNTGPSVISGDVGLSPGTAVTGFPPGMVNGTIHATDAAALQAQADVTTAYNDAAGRTPAAAVSADLGGQTLVAGVYAGATLSLTGTLTLDAQGDPTAVFVFQTASTLITASSSTVAFINGASACNVFWQVGSSATLGTNSVFVGTVLALTSITATTGASVAGRLIARDGAVTLDTNIINNGTCTTGTPVTTTTTATPTTTAPPSPTMPTGVVALPETGSHESTVIGVVALLAILMGVTLVAIQRRRVH
ncbi:MAG: ice-binding family protein [Ilumatobacteraceae bacterium]